MAKKLLVKVPRTRDGVNLMYDANRQVLYTEHIVELAALKGLNSINARKAEHLRSVISEIEVPDSNVKSIPNADLKKRLADLEKVDEKATLEKRIADLEAKLYPKQGEPSAEESAVIVSASDKIAQIKAATTIAEIDAIVGTDDRTSVLNAADKRKTQL